MVLAAGIVVLYIHKFAAETVVLLAVGTLLRTFLLSGADVACKLLMYAVDLNEFSLAQTLGVDIDNEFSRFGRVEVLG